jgi:hypothetical protein
MKKIVIVSLSVLLRMRNVTDKFVEKNRNTYFTFNDIFCKLLQKYSIADQATDDNMAHGHCMLDT